MTFHVICFHLFYPRSRRPTHNHTQSLYPSSGLSARPPGRLDVSTLESSVRRYFEAGLAPSTQKTYKAAIKRFLSFCTCYNIYTPFSVSEQLLCSFASFRGWAHRQVNLTSPRSGAYRFPWASLIPESIPLCPSSKGCRLESAG